MYVCITRDEIMNVDQKLEKKIKRLIYDRAPVVPADGVAVVPIDTIISLDADKKGRSSKGRYK